jgi:hypothetical protein
MKVDFTKTLTTLSGEPLTVNGAPMTLAIAATEGLLAAPKQGEKPLAATAAFKRYELAKRIHGASEAIDVTTEEASEVKNAVAAVWSPLVVGQVCALIEGTS